MPPNRRTADRLARLERSARVVGEYPRPAQLRLPRDDGTYDPATREPTADELRAGGRLWLPESDGRFPHAPEL